MKIINSKIYVWVTTHWYKFYIKNPLIIIYFLIYLLFYKNFLMIFKILQKSSLYIIMNIKTMIK